MAKLIVPEEIYRQTQSYLLKDHSEHLAFFLCNTGTAQGFPVFIVRDVILVDDADLEGPNGLSLHLKLEPLLAIINRAIKSKKALVEAHSHPFSEHPSFSLVDKAGFKEFVPYVMDSLKGLPYGAIVWGKQSVSGVAWPRWPKEDRVDITVVGKTLSKPGIRLTPVAINMVRYDRQIRAFGRKTQLLVGSVRIGIVGVGGIGSHVAQQLGYLGAKDLVLVDSQVVEDTNLNRLVGATPRDIGKPKVEVISAYLKRVSQKIKVIPLQADLRTSMVFDALKTCDAIFGCVDNDGARLVLNELSIAYLIPLIDCGVEIHREGGSIEQAGGRLNLVLPNEPCLYCMGQIDTEEARIALAPPEEIRRATQLGYIQGDAEPSPSVVSLNGVVASAAVTELLNLITGIRAPCSFLIYDVLGSGRGRDAQWLVPQKIRKTEQCFECSLSGIGDQVNLERYLRTENALD